MVPISYKCTSLNYILLYSSQHLKCKHCCHYLRHQYVYQFSSKEEVFVKLSDNGYLADFIRYSNYNHIKLLLAMVNKLTYALYEISMHSGSLYIILTWAYI